MMPPTARPRTLFSLTINKAKFRKPVRPGDTLEYHVDKLAQRRNTYSYRGEAKVHGVRGGAWRRLADCRALKLLRPMRAFAGYVLWVPPMTFLTTMAAMPASTAFAIGDVRRSIIGLDPEACCWV